MPQSWDLSRHIQLAVLMLILMGIIAITVRVDFWEDYSSRSVSKDAEEMQKLIANQQETLREDEDRRKSTKIKEIEERRAVMEPGK
jgi:1,4-dihydroxy-2-naphthoate octaprenyltransferase